MVTRLLLALTGTKQSLFASEVAFKLAAKTQASITAQHVIDTYTSWEFLRNDEPGLLASGLYTDAFTNLRHSQKNIANELIAVWKSLADKQNVEYKCFIDEGNPVKEICKRSKNFDLVIVGHRARLQDEPEGDPWHGVKYTVAEGLAHDCAKPLLIVQQPVKKLWKKVLVLMSPNHENSNFLRACSGMASSLGAHSEAKFIANMPPAKTDDLFLNEDFNHTLLILPTRIESSKRVSILDEPTELFVRRLSLPAILLWPEESAYKIEQIDETDTEVASSR